MKQKQYMRKSRIAIFLLLFCMTVCSILPLNSSAHTSAEPEIKLTGTVGADCINLSWNAVTHNKGVKGYYVFRATASGKYSNLPEMDFWTTGNFYQDTKVTDNTTYYYIVRPVLGDGTLGKASNEIRIDFRKQPPITLKADSGSGNIILKWNSINDSKGVLGYYVFKSTKSGGQGSIPETDFWITGNSYMDTKVTPGTTYYYIVKPVLGDKSLGQASNEVSATCKRVYGTISMTIGSTIMVVNGQKMEIDPGKKTAPVLKDARTMLPIRALIEAMGGTVDYNSSDERITVKWNGKTVILWIGRKDIQVDGKKMNIDVAPYYSETGRTMIPLRFVVENLGCTIDWNGATYTATITYSTDSTPEPVKDYYDGWQGLWFTNRGKLTLTQKGNKVTGTYGDGFTLSGTVTGSKLKGSYNEKGSSGEFEFVVSSDGKTFDGSYSYKNKQKNQWLEWDGKREEDPLAKYLRKLSSPVDFSGTWSTGLGKISIDQKKNKVVASFDDNGVIDGTVQNNKLSGTYKKGKNSWLIEIYLLEGNKEIKGYYGSSDTPKQDWKVFDGYKYNKR